MPSWKTLSVEAVRGCVREPVNVYRGHARDGCMGAGPQRGDSPHDLVFGDAVWESVVFDPA